MDELLRRRPGGESGGPEPQEHLDPLLERREDRRPWELRAAQWRAWVLAEAAFGSRVRVSLAGRRGAMGFRGHLTLDVPFHDLGEHRRRESLFLAWAGRDPVLARVPLLFVFQPSPAPLP
jgi:hypothetical protein